MINGIFWKSICTLYNILTETCHLQYIVFNVNDCFCCYMIIFYPFTKEQKYWCKHMYIICLTNHNPIFLPIQYMHNSLWIKVHKCIVKIFKFSTHSLIIFRWRENNTQKLFDQRKCSLVIGIIYPTSSNTYGRIDITSSANQLN